MYVLAPNQIVEKFPYSIGDLRKDNPQISFPANPSLEILAQWNVFNVVSTGEPEHDQNVQVAEQNGCVYNKTKNRWEVAWKIRDLTTEEAAQKQAADVESRKQNRLAAYREESDPLFFKAQRGEATQQEWLDRVAEIKQRFPE